MVVPVNYANFGVSRSLIEASSACHAFPMRSNRVLIEVSSARWVFSMRSTGVRRWGPSMQQE